MMPPYKSISMIEITKLLGSYAMQTLTENGLNAQTSDYGPYCMEAAIL